MEGDQIPKDDELLRERLDYTYGLGARGSRDEKRCSPLPTGMMTRSIGRAAVRTTGNAGIFVQGTWCVARCWRLRRGVEHIGVNTLARTPQTASLEANTLRGIS